MYVQDESNGHLLSILRGLLRNEGEAVQLDKREAELDRKQVELEKSTHQYTYRQLPLTEQQVKNSLE